MKCILLLAALSVSMFGQAFAQQQGGKVFPASDKVLYQKVSFYNRLGIQIVGDLYLPVDFDPIQKYTALNSTPALMNFFPFANIEMISPRPVLFIAGEQAHSRYFSEDAYKLAQSPKELYIVPRAGHVDLYDRVNLIPFDKLEAFFRENLK